MGIDLLDNLLLAMVRTGTPLLLAVLGELACEGSGVLNLDQEGMILFGAVIGLVVAFSSGNLWFGVLFAVFAGTLLAALFAGVALYLNVNQMVCGLVLTIFGVGLSPSVGAAWVGRPLQGSTPLTLPVLDELSLSGHMLFTQGALVYLSLALSVMIVWMLLRNHAGLVLQAVGENPDVTSAMGLPVLCARTLAILFGDAMVGLAGTYLSLTYALIWAEDMTAGHGWTALALVVFTSWRVFCVLLSAWLFGLASILHLVAQRVGLSIPANLLVMLPRAVIILVLVLFFHDTLRTRLYAPVLLGQSWKTRH